jgi:hypothetical protein
MTFSIAFQEGPPCYPYDDPSTPAAGGVLTLGVTQEEFLASLYQWRKEDYEKQWRHAISLLLNNKSKAALITTYGSPDISTHLEWWPMYLIGDTVYFQHHLLFYDQLPRRFSLDDALSFLRDRETTDEDEKRISEWEVSASEVERFAHGFL